ncbi:MAG: peroxiredoxin [Peptoniphilaceae bacterium]|nr:peroxiredoxin [Peptoniphilaceae bacterium]MDD7382903.1 peroxiredoxin [Peptoniphilaceae bacterium]MDY3737654.1 peroxiredoxin [Peptoniphilaceae bacterium]
MDYKDIKFNSLDGEKSINDYKGKNLVLYVYPKDNTKGCTTEALDFNRLLNEFHENNTEVIGLSKDSIKSHEKFRDKNELKFNILSDEEIKLIDKLGAWKLKKNYGREYMGVVRSTFIFDKNGNLVKEFLNVRVKDHAEKVLEFVKENLN